ncbi:ribonuclease III [Cucurbitaria berberidis CBS 394.84]|uniref:Ribonuclease III n=1 Tax=Cucurbitaria berberidis CBS 394.84 TaxID=1168544 RepID=A0A9P4GTA8_9PLEO|nr:ribonuclease III [Cucurbitaria berberidis CBS 394.84]KAF1851101.1 ribonuclease III [Cucurbitaria berberidis CBS 394.84]
MPPPKRGGAFPHYGDRNSHINKKQRSGQPVYSSAAYGDLPNDRGPDKPVQRSIAPPPKLTLSARDMESGLVALLDRFVANETTPNANKDILHHARELRRLLCTRTDAKSQIMRELDEKRPDNAASVYIPEYIERKVQAAKDLPPLPPIAEPHLHEAVFTHRTAHVNPDDPKQSNNISLELDYERLELLGDAYIELIASRALYNRFPQVDVPELCSWRERLVENSNLSKFSEAYGFPDRLKHRAHWDVGSKAWQKVVADMFEAYIAGLVLSNPENGFEIAENWLTELWAPQLLGFREKIIENPQARNELNKLVLVKDVKLNYREEKRMTYDSGSVQRFFIGVYLTGWGYQDEWLGSGEGQNKNQAAVSAASAAINNSPVVKNVARQKAELMEVKRLEREEAEKQEDLIAREATHGNEDKNSNAKLDSGGDTKRKERKGDAQGPSPERKKKHSKKEKKEKKCKASTDDDSS